MKTASDWADECKTSRGHPDWLEFVKFAKAIQQDCLREAAEIARRGGCTSAGCEPGSDFHGKRCPCGIADAILAKVKEIS